MLIKLSDIVDKIVAETGFTTMIAEEKMPVLSSIATLPIVYVGYLAEEPNAPESAYGEGDPLDETECLAQITTEVFSLQIITTMEDLIEHKQLVKSAVIGWNPVSVPNEYSRFRTGKGVLHALINKRVHWFQELVITQPSR